MPPSQHQPPGWSKWCSSAQPSKGQCTISKILSSPILSLLVEQKIFFPRTCFAFTISKPKFTVCLRLYFVARVLDKKANNGHSESVLFENVWLNLPRKKRNNYVPHESFVLLGKKGKGRQLNCSSAWKVMNYERRFLAQCVRY